MSNPIRPSTATSATGPYFYKGILPSYAMNYIDQEFPNLLDRTGGNITGAITVNSGGSINFVAGSQLNLTGMSETYHAANVFYNAGTTLYVDATSDIQFTSGSTIGGNTSFNGTLTVNAASGIVANLANAITATAQGGISSGTPGGIALTASDYPIYSPARTFIVDDHLNPMAANYSTGWSANSTGVIGIYNTLPNNGTPQPIQLDLARWNGATINSITVFFAVAGPHSGVPQHLPSLQAKVFHLVATGNPLTLTNLNAGSPTQSFPTPISAAAWDDSGLIQSMTYNCSAAQVINTISYLYYIIITDEYGTNSLSGNQYLGMSVNYTVSDMEPK